MRVRIIDAHVGGNTANQQCAYFFCPQDDVQVSSDEGTVPMFADYQLTGRWLDGIVKVSAP